MILLVDAGNTRIKRSLRNGKKLVRGGHYKLRQNVRGTVLVIFDTHVRFLQRPSIRRLARPARVPPGFSVAKPRLGNTSLAVNLPTVPDTDHQHGQPIVLDLADEAVIPYAVPPVVGKPPFQRLAC